MSFKKLFQFIEQKTGQPLKIEHKFAVGLLFVNIAYFFVTYIFNFNLIGFLMLKSASVLLFWITRYNLFGCPQEK